MHPLQRQQQHSDPKQSQHQPQQPQSSQAHLNPFQQQSQQSHKPSTAPSTGAEALSMAAAAPMPLTQSQAPSPHPPQSQSQQQQQQPPSQTTAQPTPGKPSVQPCRYKTGKTLGAGSYSVVKECVHIETGRYYAAKVINKRMMAGREHMVRNEIAVLKRVSMGHRNILTLVDYFETMNNLYLVTDLALGGELFDRICRKGSYYETDAADLIKATLSAVAYLHDHGIVHRDLKPENLLFRTPEDNADLLIADFGLSRIMDEEAFHVLTTTCGTPGYMAPEIFRKCGHGKPVDVWAIGVITYFLLCGYTPFDRDSNIAEMQAILVADYSFTPAEYWSGVSEKARDFIRRCLTVDATQRITAHQALSHPWIAPPPSPAHADSQDKAGDGTDLLPVVKKNFNARRTLHAAIDTIRAINKLREAGGMMNGGHSHDPPRQQQQQQQQADDKMQSDENENADTPSKDNTPKAPRSSQAPIPPALQNRPSQHPPGVPPPQISPRFDGMQGVSSLNAIAEDRSLNPSTNAVGSGSGGGPSTGSGPRHDAGGGSDAMEVEGEPGERFVGQGGDEMEIDGRGHGHGQTEEMIRAQERRIAETARGLWSKPAGQGQQS